MSLRAAPPTRLPGRAAAAGEPAHGAGCGAGPRAGQAHHQARPGAGHEGRRHRGRLRPGLQVGGAGRRHAHTAADCGNHQQSKDEDERKCRVHRIGRHSVRPNILSTSHRPLDRLYLQTKLSNPHYKPEIAAQCTLVNFCVTEKVRAGVPHGPCIRRAWPAGPCRQDASRGRATPRCLRPCASSPSPSCSL